jgi:hypothetical protein
MQSEEFGPDFNQSVTDSINFLWLNQNRLDDLIGVLKIYEAPIKLFQVLLFQVLLKI